MTLKEKLKVHAEIERQNRAKLEAWKEYPKTWREQVETRLMNLRLAEEALEEMREMGVIS